MKKIFLAVAVMGIAAAASTAQAGVRFSIGIPAPVFAVPAPRVYVQSAPVVYAPAPVYVAPAPVCAPPAVIVAPPVVYAPRPVVRFGFGFEHAHSFYRHGRW
jgi:hypothetical protein